MLSHLETVILSGLALSSVVSWTGDLVSHAGPIVQRTPRFGFSTPLLPIWKSYWFWTRGLAFPFCTGYQRFCPASKMCQVGTEQRTPCQCPVNNQIFQPNWGDGHSSGHRVSSGYVPFSIPRWPVALPASGSFLTCVCWLVFPWVPQGTPSRFPECFLYATVSSAIFALTSSGNILGLPLCTMAWKLSRQ